MYLMGLDGGGSHLRVAVVNPDLTIHTELKAASANPNVIGHLQAVDVIQAAIRDCLVQAGVSSERIIAVGAGVAGAAHAPQWLREAIRPVLPGAVIVPSSDMEIALIGAHGKRQGVLALAGTGSVAYGVNAAGEAAQVGGWGYLIGDEGSGYWIGMEALHAMTRAVDGRDEPTRLTERVLDALELETPYQILTWLYAPENNRTREIAGLAPLVLAEANHNDVVAQRIIRQAAEELAQLCRTVIRRLAMSTPEIAFSGSILLNDNALSRTLCDLLGLTEIPKPRYTPVVGAALMATLEA